MTDAKIHFIGVTTQQSSVMKVFPKWADILGLDAEIMGWDLPIRAGADAYRQLVQHIKDDMQSVGALVTVHKIDLLRACHDMFDELDRYARICGEVSCLAKSDGRFRGFAKDPISSALALSHFVPAGHWRAGKRDVLCLGAGGAATAISVCMGEQSQDASHPRRFILTDISSERLDSISSILARLDTNIRFEAVLVRDAADSDACLRDLPAGSLVINATGLGKDRPGSPLTDGVQFPQDGLVWELNYRGERRFMGQAQAQAAARHLTVEDGWMYFLHGWAQAIAEIFQLQITDDVFRQLGSVAAALRPG